MRRHHSVGLASFLCTRKEVAKPREAGVRLPPLSLLGQKKTKKGKKRGGGGTPLANKEREREREKKEEGRRRSVHFIRCQKEPPPPPPPTRISTPPYLPTKRTQPPPFPSHPTFHPPSHPFCCIDFDCPSALLSTPTPLPPPIQEAPHVCPCGLCALRAPLRSHSTRRGSGGKEE